eukprot:6194310-Pleurochrysis_carterae.AAC.4
MHIWMCAVSGGRGRRTYHPREHARYLAQVEIRSPAGRGTSRPSKRRRGGVVAFGGEEGAGKVDTEVGASSVGGVFSDDDLPWRAAFLAGKKAQRKEAECKVDSASLRAIREKYGEMSERLIHMLLNFDALSEFRKVMRRVLRLEPSRTCSSSVCSNSCALYQLCEIKMNAVVLPRGAETASFGSSSSALPWGGTSLSIHTQFISRL